MRLGIIIGVFLLVLAFGSALVELFTDWLWFDSLGQVEPYFTTVTTRVGLFAAGFATFLVWYVLHYFVARRLSPRRLPAFTLEGGVWRRARFDQAYLDRILLTGTLSTGIFFGIVFGAALSSEWRDILVYLYQRPFGQTDPLFGYDVGYFVFNVPLYRFAVGWLFGLVALGFGLSLAIYSVTILGFNFTLLRYDFAVSRGVLLHLATQIAITLIIAAAHYRLEAFDLVYSRRGTIYGAGYTDVSVVLPTFTILSVILVVAAALVLLSAYQRGYHLLIGAGGAWAIVMVLGLYLAPSAVQSFQVLPSELDKERDYIAANIRLTRQAFGLDRIEERSFPAEESISPAEVRNNPETIANIRLWDHRPLLQTYGQIQSIRQVYKFRDVDIDRYEIDGRYQQVMLGARELAPENLSREAQTWVNRRLQYTHGYGVVMSPVSEVSREGLPNLLLRNIPPVGVLPVQRPEIYFGETPDGHIFVNTGIGEFDYPKEDENVFSFYTGKDGILLNSVWRRLAYALYLGDPNIMLSSYLNAESRVIYRRNLADRISRLAPFVQLDYDPYIVIADGKLYWIQDAYTTSSRYPYATPVDVALPVATNDPRRPYRVNYMRNSVKAVVDAYDGTTTLYVADPTDPIIQSYSALFPTLLRPLEEMPASLRRHVRYPEQLFLAQSEVLRSYHLTDTQVFYNREDQWGRPKELFESKPVDVEPYFVIMKLPGEARVEFLQMMPFTPATRENMIAWLAARSDEPHYGGLILFKYPKDRLIYGPSQVESRIDQDAQISQQLKLWSGSGSEVIRGNLLVIPIGNSNLYVEPIYLKASRSEIPELRRVVVATGNRIVMEPTLAEAMARLVDGAASPGTGTAGAPPDPGSATGGARPPDGAVPPVARPPEGTTPPATGSTNPEVARLAQSARDHYNRAQEALRSGDWTRYGEELRALEQDLNRLVQLSGQ
ncbi:MAG: UPF0182 family protein [Chloroflexi bacterium]|nr:UPF0182 family protein [Chloroflexota bacterium]